MRVMMLYVTGIPHPYRKLVSVQDEVQFLGITRIAVLRDLISTVPDETQSDVLRDMRVNLKDTGLNEYPESDREVEALYRTMP